MTSNTNFSLYDGEWYIDCEALMEWISRCPNSEQNVETTILQSYPSLQIIDDIAIDDSDEIQEKVVETSRREITETKNTKNEFMNTVRMNLIFTFIGNLLSSSTGDFGTTDIFKDEELSLKHKLSANTLIQLGILKKV